MINKMLYSWITSKIRSVWFALKNQSVVWRMPKTSTTLPLRRWTKDFINLRSVLKVIALKSLQKVLSLSITKLEWRKIKLKLFHLLIANADNID
jgi:hypothetical protein